MASTYKVKWPHNHLGLQDQVTNKKIFDLHHHNAYGHKTWQDGELPWATSTHKATWLCNHMAMQDHVIKAK